MADARADVPDTQVFEPRIGRSVSLDHAAEMLGVSRRTIYNRIREGGCRPSGPRRIAARAARLGAGRTARRPRRSCSGVAESQTLTVTPFPAWRSAHGPDVSILSLFSQDAHSRVLPLRCVVALVAAAPAAPAAAQRHRARLSADLADHLAAGSQAIDVIVHGDARDGGRARRALQPASSRVLQSGAVLRVNAGQLAALRQDEAVDHLSGDIRIQSSVGGGRRRATRHRRRPGVGGRGRRAGADGTGRHGGGDRLGDRHAAQRAQGARAA